MKWKHSSPSTAAPVMPSLIVPWPGVSGVVFPGCWVVSEWDLSKELWDLSSSNNM